MDKKYERILVAVDKSEGSKLVYQRAIRNAVASQAKLAICYVIETVDYGTVISIEPALIDKAKANAMTYLNKIKEEALAEGVKDVEVFLEVGDVKRVIVDRIAGKYDPDLIICGDRNLKKIEYLFLGSVSNYIVHRATCDVLIVKRD